MPAADPDLDNTIYAKSALGQQEIASRSLGLTPMVRRLLILVDGKRSGRELRPMVDGQDLGALINQLLEKGCIEQVATRPVAPPVAAPAPAAASTRLPAPGAPAATPATEPGASALATLPDAQTRSAKDVEMARNFMTNTVNTVFQAYTRLTLLEAIAACQTAQDTRRVYMLWEQTIGSSLIGAKRLPEFREKLFKVL